MQVLIPTRHIETLGELLQSVNRYAKSVNGDRRKAAYALKHELASAIMNALAEQVDVDYQFDARSGQTMVLLRLRAENQYCFHLPFDRLNGSARARLINAKGTPAAFQRRFDLRA